jgi:putative methyltransferase (TIGR04325 family)
MAISDRIRAVFARAPQPRSDWEGVYDRFEDVPVQGGGFNDDAWTVDTRRLTELARNEYAARGHAVLHGDAALLPLIAASLAAARALRVLDFGGGMGISFLQLCAALTEPTRLEYHVVETPRLCAEGERLHAGDMRIRFHATLPTLPDPDIVYVNSALQYVRDVPELVKTLCSLAPKFILLVRCSAGTTRTFATAQVTLPGKRIPYWFLNLEELAAQFRGLGYALAFAARSSAELHQAALPPECRQGSTMNLLFSRLGS